MSRKHSLIGRRGVALVLAVAASALVVPNGVGAQTAIVWGVIDCSLSRLVAPPGTTCRATNEVAFTDHDFGQFKYWSVRGNNPYYFMIVGEGLNSKSRIMLTGSGPDYLREISPLAKGAAIIAGPSQRNGADYYVFTSSRGQACTGFRKPGPPRSDGHIWLIGGVLCMAKGTPLDQTRIFEFVDSAKVK